MTDNRLVLETTFAARYPDVTAASAGADGKVNTALTPSRYITYNWNTGKYDSEAR